MAKNKQRMLFGFKCDECGSLNYRSKKNKLNDPEKMTLNKFCNKCRKVTPHKEVAKLK